ncbi:MAG: hypothetical protein ACREQ7_22025 [Candidatus Binatia bacterium]
MAQLIGCLALSHGPQLLMPPEKWHELPTRVESEIPEKPELAGALTLEEKQSRFSRCRKAMEALRRTLDKWAPDVVVVLGDDQHENLLDDNMPPFLIYAGKQAAATLKFGYLGERPTEQMTEYPTHPRFALSLINELMARGFDPAWSTKTRYEAGLGHAFGRPLSFISPRRVYPIVPLMVNTYFPPVPSAKRCFEVGKALARAIERCTNVNKVVVVASGGLSHVRIDEALDREFIRAVEKHDERYLSSVPASVLVDGTSELLIWIIIAAAAGKDGTVLDYVPCYRTITGIGCAMGFAYWERS